MAVQADFTGIEPSTGWEPLPEGEYVMVVHEVEEVTAKTGTPGIRVTFRVAVGEHRDHPVTDTLWITPKAMPFVMQRLEALGVQVPNGPLTIDERLLHGRRAQLLVRHEPWEDRDGNARVAERVKAYEPVPGDSSSTPDPLANAVPARTDDDIPF